MKKIMIVILLLSLLCPINTIGQSFDPLHYDKKYTEIYDINVKIYLVTRDVFDYMLIYYLGKPRSNIVGMCLRIQRRTTLITTTRYEIYLPKDKHNRIDIAVLGHEIGHVMDYHIEEKELKYFKINPDGEGKETRFFTTWESLEGHIDEMKRF